MRLGDGPGSGVRFVAICWYFRSLCNQLLRVSLVSLSPLQSSAPASAARAPSRGFHM